MDIDPNKLFSDVTFGSVVLWILALATLVTVLDNAGFLPPRIAKWLARNRLDTTITALRRLGVRVRIDDDRENISFLQRALQSLNIQVPAYKIRLRELLRDDKYEGEVEVGMSREFTSNGFIDVMGSSTDPVQCKRYARLLKTHADLEGVANFDIVATPKTGSPLLGNEFASLTSKPFVVGPCEKARGANGMNFHAKLDYRRSLDLNGKRALIVDDSTTGGTKIIALAQLLREAGAVVEEALVLFEPKGKNARERLEATDIILHSIEDGPVGRF